MRTRLAALLALSLPSLLAAQARHEIVRGRVTSDSGRAVAGADVVVTRTSDMESHTTQTTRDGAYATDWLDGNGDYAVTVSASGFQPRSLHAVRAASSDSVIVVDVRLSSQAHQLAAVETRARRPIADNDPASYGAGNVEATTYGQNAARRLAPDQAGDLNAIAAMLPGVSALAGGGISVLGLPSNQNAVILNGLGFGGADLPRDASTRVRVQASSYDPANGWFSGAQTLVDLTPGGQFTTRTGHWTVDAPALQYTDRVSSRSGQQYTNLDAGLGGTGRLLNDAWSYNFGLQGARRTSPVASMLTADEALLAHAGVAPDSARRLVTLLGQAGIPLTAHSVPEGTLDENMSLIARADRSGGQPSSPAMLGVQGYAKWSRTAAQSLGATGTPAHSGETTQRIGSVAAFWSRVFGAGYLVDLRSGVTRTDHATSPYVTLPDGRAQVVSALPDGSNGVSTLLFGGNAGLDSRARAWRWETNGQVQFYPSGAVAHRVKLAADARFDRYDQDVATNRFGTFTYNSLDALANGVPTSFTRTLVAPSRRGGEWNAFASLGDLWRVNEKLQVVYGARVDGNVFVHLPDANPAVADAFGVRTDRAPRSLAVSPRLGFTYQTNGRILRGGVGQFRNAVDASLMAGPSAATGLPGSLLRVACVGAATPSPDWPSFLTDPASIPTQCAGSASGLVDAAPDVQLVDPAYQPARSWRANLGFQSSVKRTVYGIEEIASYNLDQPGVVDRNFDWVPSFWLANELRPMYVPASSIVPATGAVSPTLSRANDGFGRVGTAVSDLRSLSHATLLTLRPYVPQRVRPYFGDVSLSYTMTHVRAQQRGFDGSTAGDPAAREWARGDLDARHAVVGQMVLRPMGDSRALLFVYGRVQSGLPFTPMVGSDVNGDGLANDRAFIFDPAGATVDSALARQMRSLLASASPNVRACLAGQLGRAAGRNSCEGPWTAQLNASLQLNGQQLLHMSRTTVRVNFANPLGGLDQLLHGASLRGWGAPARPDGTLYTVRGFSATSGFAYAVNPRFGDTRPSSSTLRAPFRMTLDVSVDLARPLPDQMLQRWLRPGRNGQPGARIAAADLMRRLQRTVPDPYADLLQQSDSLLLSDAQVGQLQAAEASYRAAVDAKWSEVSRYLGGLGDRYDQGDAARRLDSTTEDVWELTRRDVQSQLADILTPAQTAQLGGFTGMLFRARDRVHVRLAPSGG